MLGGRKITATHMGEKLEGSVAKCFPQRGILLPLLRCLIVVKVRGNGWEWLIYTGVCAFLISEKFPNSVLHLLQEALSMEQ